MTDDEILVAALEKPTPAERAAYLDGACGADAELRAKVEGLLRSHEDAGSFLEQPLFEPGPTLDQPPQAEGPGTMIGPYKLLQQIGEGGMGTVYMAEQAQPVHRKVALKVIKPGMDSRQVIARFEAERQALAMMDHVNIARVFDGGTTSGEPGGVSPGRPYFVMELVHGVPITKYCDDNHLTPRERLELFVPVCQAIQHAHQKGTIHRDIKPNNVMVTLYDGKPVPKVIDFGVAKATEQKLTERTLFTQYGTMVGTLEYMSPEQAEMSALGVDTRSDIYSLGVLLYELLTGSTPLSHKRMKEAAYAEILRMIKEEEPPKPSTRLSDSGEALASISANRHTEPAKLTRLVRGELDWIVMKALEKDRNRRYETANGFAADMQRYLNDEAVQACPPSAWYRVRKFARRNKRALVSAALLGGMLLVLAGSLGWMASDRAAQRGRTAIEVKQFLHQAELHYADNKLPEAVAEVQKARGVLEAGSGDEDLGRRVRQWLTDLDTAAKLEEIWLEVNDMTDRDRGYADFARVFREYAIDVEALSTEALTARVADSQIKFDLVLALGHWASLLRFDPRPQDSARWQRLLAISRAADPDPWRLRLDQAVEAKDAKTLRELADGAEPGRLRTRTLAYLGSSLRTAGDAAAAVAFLRKAQRLHPGDFSINASLASSLYGLQPPPLDEVIAFGRAALAVRPHSPGTHTILGVALRAQKKLDEAIAEHRKAIELDPKAAYAHNNLGVALKDQKKLDEAIAEHRKAIELDPNAAYAHNGLGLALKAQKKLDEAIAEHRKAIELDPKDALAHNNFGAALQDQKKLDEAIAEYCKAIELDPKYAFAHYNLGLTLDSQGKVDEAIVAYRKAIEIDPTHFSAHLGLALALKSQGKLDDAIAALRKAVELAPEAADARVHLGWALHNKKCFDEAMVEYREAIRRQPGYAQAHNNLGLALRDQNKLDEAIAEYRKAIELDPKYAWAHNNLGAALEAQGKVDEAIAEYRKAIELDAKLALGYNNLGTALRRRGKLDDAIAALRKAVEILPKAHRADQGPSPALAHVNLGNALYDQNKLGEAIAVLRKAIELDAKLALAHNNLGNALQAQGKLDEAIACYRKAIELDPKDANAHNGLGSALKSQGKLDEAIACYRKAIELDPKDALPHYNLGIALRAQRKLDEAIACYRKAIELDPKFAFAHDNLGLALYDQKKLAEAIACFRKAIEFDPKSVYGHTHLGSALEAQGKLDEAIACYRKAIELDPNSVWTLNKLAWLLATCHEVKFRDPMRAMELAKKALELAPQDGESWKSFGAAHYGLGDWKAAIAAFEKANTFFDGGGSNEWFFIAMARWQLGEKDQARQAYDRALQWMEKNHPKNEGLRRLRAEAAELLGIEKKKD